VALHARVFFSVDSEVIGPERSAENVCLLVREMRKAKPAPGLPDLLVMARVFHTLFTECPEMVERPILSRHEGDQSLLRSVLRWAEYEDWDAFERAEAEDYLAGANIARWVLGMRQQPHPLLVLCDPPVDIEGVVIPRQCPQRRLNLIAG
jgi:uncharacterized protein (DUF58 family)